MATQKIYLDLAKADNWIASDNADGVVTGAYEQKEGNLPRVLWNLNCIPFSNGIKSLTPSNAIQLDSLPTSNFESGQWDIEVVTARDGTIIYMLTDTTSENDNGKHIYYLTPTGTTPVQWADLITEDSGNESSVRFPHKYSTIFQNITVMGLTDNQAIGSQFDIFGDAISGNDLLTFGVTPPRAFIYNIQGLEIGGFDRKNGITSYQNYLIFWDDERVYWSSPTDFADFTPAIGGGGSSSISEAKGGIITIVPNASGLMVYCKFNVVHVAFSGDTSNPWIFREVPNSEGVLINNERVLITSSAETSEFHVFLSSTGLQVVNENGTQPLNADVLEFLVNSEVEVRNDSDCKIRKDYYDLQGMTTKVKFLKLIDTKLFIGVGDYKESASTVNRNRLYIYDISTGTIAKLDGKYSTVCPLLNLNKNTISSSYTPQRQPDAIPNKFLAARSTSSNIKQRIPVALDYAGNIERQLGIFPSELERTSSNFLVGPISISRQRTTVIHRIRFEGDLQAIGDTDSIIKVRVYSEQIQGSDVPTEFTYNPDDNWFYGYAEGYDLLIEVEGDHFYLTGLEVELERGGTY